MYISLEVEKLLSEIFFKKIHIFQKISLVSLCYTLYILNSFFINYLTITFITIQEMF